MTATRNYWQRKDYERTKRRRSNALVQEQHLSQLPPCDYGGKNHEPAVFIGVSKRDTPVALCHSCRYSLRGTNEIKYVKRVTLARRKSEEQLIRERMH